MFDFVFKKILEKMHDAVQETEIVFKHSALLLSEKQVSVFFTANIYHTIFVLKKAYFILTKIDIFESSCRFLCHLLCKNAVRFIVKSMFFISVCFGIVNSREV